jgi:hypothetical protein
MTALTVLRGVCLDLDYLIINMLISVGIGRKERRGDGTG